MDTSKITKRQFLRLMGGASLGLLPFIGCYSREKKPAGPAEKKSLSDSTRNRSNAEYQVTDKDVIILMKGEGSFDEYNISYNKRVQQLPKYIAVCFTDEGVAYALKKAKEEQLPVAVKSGGHSFEGFSSNNDGMVLNLSRMKKIEWLDNNEVSIEPGILLKELHERVYAKGRLLPAGSCGGVGIAGLTLGGGYGFFSRKYGLTCDSLINAVMVTAGGEVKQASDDPELLWALRGGGNGNFGVVTSLRFRTQPMPADFSSYTVKHKVEDADSFRQLLKLWMDSVYQLPQEAFAAFVQNGKTLTLLFTTYGKAAEIERWVTPFHGNAVSKSASITKPLVTSLKRFYGRAEPLFFKNASCGYFNGYADVEKIAAELYEKVTGQPGIILQFNTLGGAIDTESFSSVSCYPHRSYHYLGELQGYYDSKGAEPGILKSFAGIQRSFRENGVEAHYRNYPDIDFENWETAYYGAHYKKLQQIKDRYDPENSFRYPQSIRGSKA